MNIEEKIIPETILQEKKETLLQTGEEYVKKVGPGIVTGAADDDPSGIATYSQAGAQFGTSLLWISAWVYPLVANVQEMCARIALVTGRGLASNIKRNFPKKILYICTILLFFANTLNIGADLGAMAKTVQLLSPKISLIPWEMSWYASSFFITFTTLSDNSFAMLSLKANNNFRVSAGKTVFLSHTDISTTLYLLS